MFEENYETDKEQAAPEETPKLDERVLVPNDLGFSGSGAAGAGGSGGGGDRDGRSGGGMAGIRDALLSTGASTEQMSAIASLGKRTDEALAVLKDNIKNGKLDDGLLKKMQDALTNQFGDAPKDTAGSKALHHLSELINEQRHKEEHENKTMPVPIELPKHPEPHTPIDKNQPKSSEFTGLLERLKQSLEAPDRHRSESGFFGNLADKIRGSQQQQPQFLGPFTPPDAIDKEVIHPGRIQKDPPILYQA